MGKHFVTVVESRPLLDGIEELPREVLEAQYREQQARIERLETALREVKHRAKNTLQLISSLFRLHHDRVHDPSDVVLFDRLQQQVEVLTILYRLAQDASAPALIDLSIFVREVATEAVNAAGRARYPLQLTIAAEPVMLELSSAMPIGLILNEVVSAAAGHAFPAEGHIRVELKVVKGNLMRLTVNDNGRAMPPGFDELADTEEALADALATQLGADLQIHRGTETEVTLTLAL